MDMFDLVKEEKHLENMKIEKAIITGRIEELTFLLDVVIYDKPTIKVLKNRRETVTNFLRKIEKEVEQLQMTIDNYYEAMGEFFAGK